MARLNQIIAKHFSGDEIEELAGILGVPLVPNNLKSTMARELYLGARRNLRLDVLFEEVYEQKGSTTSLDLGKNLYELIGGTFDEKEAAQLTAKLGFDQMNIGLGADDLIGWNHDDFYKRQKAELIQKTAVENGQYNLLLGEIAALRSNIKLTAFKLSALAKGEGGPQPDHNPAGQANPLAKKDRDRSANAGNVYHIYGDNFMGDKVGKDKIDGDKVGGDKVEGDMYKDITASVNTGSAIPFVGNASVTNVNQVQNRDDLLNLISQINQELAAIKAELDAQDAEEAVEILDDIEQEVQAETPNANRIARKLRNVSEIAEMVTTGVQVTANIGLAIQAVQALFGG